jgi:tRNA U38,U39,U40 pseudouridine synthase TruA
MIEVKYSGDNEWLVTVNGAVTTQHRVRVTVPEIDHLAQGRPVEELLQESFRFLLEREPNTSILPSFGLILIGRYFPEYQQEIRLRLAKQP